MTRTKYQRKPKDSSLKGPGLRLNLDVRRLWQCPACQTERHTAGYVTFVECHFCQDHPAMTLVEKQRPNRDPISRPESLIELHPDDINAPAFLPVHLRESEEQPPGDAAPSDETTTDETAAGEKTPSLAASEDAVIEVEATPVTASPSTAGQTNPSANAPARGKKKSRRKRSRSGNESALPDQSDSDARSSAANTPASADSPPSPADSFGAGLEPS